MQEKESWIDRVASAVAPRWHFQRVRARMATELVRRHYEAATIGRRTQGWKRTITDANSAIGPSLARLREIARDLVRNNPYAESALTTIADHAVGWGIVATQQHEAWKRWTETTAIDADGRHDLTGLQKLVMRTVVESGECLIRRRYRRIEDGFPLPLQLQILEPDFLDSFKDGPTPNGGRIVQGVEFDALGRRAGYWLYREHPGSTSLASSARFGASSRIPAADVLHVFKSSRPGQVRAPSWFAPVLLRFKDFDEFEDATLMKQKIAACLAVITSDTDGSAPALGSTDEATPEIDSLEPGMILNVPPGRDVQVVQPPSVREYADYSKTSLRAIATGIGVSYEDLTGDYTGMPFSAARMSRLRHFARVEDWRWRMLIPQLCDPVWGWAMEASAIMGFPVIPSTDWTAPPLPMIDPANEALGALRNVRTGISTLSEEIRARGYDPARFLDELENDFKELDRRGLVLDCDPRKMTQAGQSQAAPTKTDAASAPAKHKEEVTKETEDEEAEETEDDE